MKVLLLVCDGLADRPCKELKGMTPLESAKTPNLNKLATDGITGIMDVVGTGIRPGSDVAHLSLFGYEYSKYYPGRGPLEAAGVGIKLKQGDVAFRANFATIKDGIITDRRAGRPKTVEPLTKSLNGISIDGIKFIVKAGAAHRAAVVMRGKNLSSAVSDVDPHKTMSKPLKSIAEERSMEARRTAAAINKFVNKAHSILRIHPFNKERVARGKNPANYILLRGAGQVKRIPSFEKMWGFKACCIAGAALYKGVAAFVGMDVLEVKGATGDKHTNIKAKLKAALNALSQDYDFAFVHVKACDNFGHDGDAKGKKRFIEKIDKACSMLKKADGVLTVVTADHSTPCSLKDHSGDPVPLLMHGEGVRKDSVNQFGERPCMQGGLHRIKGVELMQEIINVLGKNELVGA
jgi:2,3-bisphosphoglycerate-independent phosphoglycerate mutase